MRLINIWQKPVLIIILKEPTVMMQKKLMSLDMDTEFSTGQMVLIMKVTGILIKPKGKVPFGTLKVMCITVRLKTIWQTELVNIPILMEVNIKVNLKTMYKKAMEKKSGSMELSTLEHIKTE